MEKKRKSENPKKQPSKKKKEEIQEQLVDSGILLQQRDVVKKLCKSLETGDLMKFVLSNKTILSVCKEELAGRKESEKVIREGRKLTNAIIKNMKEKIDNDIEYVVENYKGEEKKLTIEKYTFVRDQVNTEVKTKLLPFVVSAIEKWDNEKRSVYALVSMKREIHETLSELFKPYRKDYRWMDDQTIWPLLEKAIETSGLQWNV